MNNNFLDKTEGEIEFNAPYITVTDDYVISTNSVNTDISVTISYSVSDFYYDNCSAHLTFYLVLQDRLAIKRRKLKDRRKYLKVIKNWCNDIFN